MNSEDSVRGSEVKDVRRHDLSVARPLHRTAVEQCRSPRSGVQWMLEIDPVQLPPGPSLDVGPLSCDEFQASASSAAKSIASRAACGSLPNRVSCGFDNSCTTLNKDNFPNAFCASAGTARAVTALRNSSAQNSYTAASGESARSAQSHRSSSCTMDPRASSPDVRVLSTASRSSRCRSPINATSWACFSSLPAFQVIEYAAMRFRQSTACQVSGLKPAI